jgi:hypothetical protein
MAVNENFDIQSSLSHGITMVSICVDMSESHITMVPQWFTEGWQTYTSLINQLEWDKTCNLVIAGDLT